MMRDLENRAVECYVKLEKGVIILRCRRLLHLLNQRLQTRDFLLSGGLSGAAHGERF
jgi:hypothetical protein